MNHTTARQIVVALLREDRRDLARSFLREVTANKPKPLSNLGMFMSEWIGYANERLKKEPGGAIWYKREQHGRDPLYRKIKTEGKKIHSWRSNETYTHQGKTYVLISAGTWGFVAWRRPN